MIRGNNEMKADTINMIKEFSEIRDENGFWTHPAWPVADEELIPNAWFAERGLEISIVEMDGDAPEEVAADYFERGESSCAEWEPTRPSGRGWFIFSIHDTEDGPV